MPSGFFPAPLMQLGARLPDRVPAGPHLCHQGQPAGRCLAAGCCGVRRSLPPGWAPGALLGLWLRPLAAWQAVLAMQAPSASPALLTVQPTV